MKHLFAEDDAGLFLECAQRALRWLQERMFPLPLGRGGVWERLRIDIGANSGWVRPDCTAEAARAFLLLHEAEPGRQHRTIAKNLLTRLLTLQFPFGAFPFYHFVPEKEGDKDATPDGPLALWPNDNGKVLLLLSEMEGEFGGDTRAAAGQLAQFLVSHQSSEGWFHMKGTDFTGPCFVSWPAAGLARFHGLTRDEAARAAAGRAIDYLRGLQLDDGRIRTTYEIMKSENWRPASSETAEALKAFAIAQRHLAIDLSREMDACFRFLQQLTHESGAIRNCDDSCSGASEQNESRLTDLVYTGGYAQGAYLDAYAATGEEKYLEAALRQARFHCSIQCRGESPEWDGALRGSYDLETREWRGRANQQNALDEGGMYSVYTGWSTLQITIALLRLWKLGTKNTKTGMWRCG